MQFHAQGDQPPNGCGNGHTLALTTASRRLTLAGQQVQGDTSVTTPADVYRQAVHASSLFRIDAMRISPAL